MGSFRVAHSPTKRGAALLIVLAMVVLMTGLAVAYLSRTTNDRQVAHTSFNQSKVDVMAQSAMDLVIGDLQQEIKNGSTAISEPDGSTVYMPTASANMVPQHRANGAGMPNLIRRSVSSDSPASPGVGSLASAVNSTTDASANGRFVSLARWNTHYLLPKYNTLNNDTYPPSPLRPPYNPNPAVPNGFTPPDWVFVAPNPNNTTQDPRQVITSPSQLVIGRYAYAIYDEGGLMDMNVAGYPTNTSTIQSGRKGSVAFADLTALGSSHPFFNPTSGGQAIYQVDRLVGWRNYATTNQPGTSNNNFPDVLPSSQAFARNFQSSATAATSYFTAIVTNTSGFLSPNTTIGSNGLTDQVFAGRKQLIGYQQTQNTNNGTPIANTTQFDVNALQYLSTFSRETNAPSFSPSTPAGSTIDYAGLANTATAVNPNFLSRRVTTSFTRFDGTTAVVGEPLVKTRFPLSRLAWITYKGPSASLATTDPVYTALYNALVNAGYSSTSATATISAGTAANIKACFGLTFPIGGAAGSPWTYTNPGGASGASRILRLDEVAAAGREPDFFELLQAGILNGSLGQNTGGGTTGGNVFPDVHMSSTIQHLLTIGASIIDQADPDSIPTRIQFAGTNGTWTAYGVENLPYITQMYPIAGVSPANTSKWATYLLFQLWNPHQNAPSTLPVPVRLRVDGGVGIFAGGNGETWNTTSTEFINTNGTTAGQSVTLNPAANGAASFSSIGAPISNQNTTVTTAPTPPAFAAVYAPAIPTPTP